MAIHHGGKLPRDELLKRQLIHSPMIRIGRTKHLERFPLTRVKTKVDFRFHAASSAGLRRRAICIATMGDGDSHGPSKIDTNRPSILFARELAMTLVCLGLQRSETSSTRQHFSVKMPRGVPEHRQDNGETEQQRDHPDRQACRHD
ncbi:MAG TPA: hypothetical protein VG224_07985, partial [Reyranella sp.]|nr:hypothetical protein [Reyranella sp.]